MKNLGNLVFKVSDSSIDINKYFWNAKIQKYEKYPLLDRYINSDITAEEFTLHKNECDENNCYYCEHTLNGVEEGTLRCALKSSSNFNKVIDNLTLCDGFAKISEIQNDYK